jgi:CheY-like chemotaxis protein
MRLRLHTFDPDSSGAGSSPDGVGASAGGDGSADRPRRLNLLLTYGGWREHAFADQLPVLLDRFGIQCLRAQTGDEVSDVVRRAAVHIAVIDLSIPMHARRGADNAPRTVQAGPRVLQLLRRLDRPPPTIIVRPRQVDPAESNRILAEALRDGAFTVLDDPVPVESMLQALERCVRRYYRDHWPAA